MSMKTLLIGFDSAWTANNSGAIVGVIKEQNGTFRELGEPIIVNFPKATAIILNWQEVERPESTLILIDQPTIVVNNIGQRPVENIVASTVGRRYGGVQPANAARIQMFGNNAPVWPFLDQFGGAANPLNPTAITNIFETYPVLAMISLGWILNDNRPTGRLPKYNPQRIQTFSINDWRYVSNNLYNEINYRNLPILSNWLLNMRENNHPIKENQDCLDACICLLVAIKLAEFNDCIMVGNTTSGYMVVPDGDVLRQELVIRCISTARDPVAWVNIFTL